MISAKSVKELRERTGAGMMDCKKALTETDGDIEKAVEVLREKGLAAAAKKSGRVAAEGLVKTYISEDKKSGAIVELNCETDFVAANEDFIAFADALAKIATSTSATTVEELVNEKFDSEATIQEALTGLIARLGENMTVRRFVKFAVDNGVVKSYIHGGGRIGVLVEVACDVESPAVEEVAKELCMQIAAANPLFLSKEEVDQDSIEKEKEIYRVQALNEGKPEKIVEKMVMGRIQKYYKEVCLLEQLWVKDGDKTITKFIDEKAKEAGSAIKVNRFVRFERGEGIEKVEENFAEEVAKQLGK
ncbi:MULTISPECIES: translation elongation factor Ts [Clostridium]|uniref:Elongation factor Ts n=1 Tax=Clostridium botulinum (strain Eklund 17B / Type B) TaxID=935198 RepID=EFTS_CLOBB|nr:MULTISPECIES: translation elongation factor Ts [Clostridium]B2TJ41.1 RecName: Full=Elongation factor Ts; Short=EF-Ts [Clostridium botulinum B str. Eklund 17B (NRP)]MBN1044924.1 elongation factor Ts [Clostridium botulinum]ACD25047.1 translation elongation factor Ts [Clostridium botulinum B str. Eklund 17B (NRP)]MBN1051649.1 elongation factor Ts [Clostridium botulinum]MBN1054838.1 elongation factor Ts [Clostridium botulinum]MBY6974919.1 elongation factor Ts [Clostridium botulinum]